VGVVNVLQRAPWAAEWGQTPGDVELIKPLHDGVISDPDVVVASGITRSRSTHVGDNEMDAAIVQAVRSQLRLLIGERVLRSPARMLEPSYQRSRAA
jgi:actin-like ATPase involved in cell morphogenesis